jgi:hypothetical protein
MQDASPNRGQEREMTKPHRCHYTVLPPENDNEANRAACDCGQLIFICVKPNHAGGAMNHQTKHTRSPRSLVAKESSPRNDFGGGCG